jgi:acyl-CoA synthetase (AMP-forming)/AMP-acid ligase II
MGTLSADGYLSITGRKKEMVIVGGMNVFPAEVEGVMDNHPGTMMVAAVGEHDEKRGESIKLYVVPRDPRLIGTEEAMLFAQAMAQQAAAMGLAANAGGSGGGGAGAAGGGSGAAGDGAAAAYASLDELEVSLKQYANENLPQFKRPRAYEFRPSLPIGPTGKVAKKLL